MKKSLVILFSFILMSSFFISGIYAQENSATDTNVAENNLPVEVPENTLASSVGYVSPEGEVVSTSDEIAIEEKKFNELVKEAEGFNEELGVDAGLTPNSPFYFIDTTFDNFASEENLREERIAEMQVLAPQCGQGDDRACRYIKESFERYKEHAEQFEKSVSPEQRETALRSSEAIRGTFVKEIAQNLPPREKDEMVRELVQGENNIAIAAEIAGKIKELCVQLAELDPNEYSRVCRIEGDAPDWRKELDRDLTDEQRKEALKFGEIMSQCFETSGQNCRCEEIPFTDFAEACAVAAPLATACEIEENEEACEQLDDLEMPELPQHLEDIFENLEMEMNEDKYGMYLPPECEKAGATLPKECAKIMINEHAPEECRQALLDADVHSESEGRKICDKIMFEKNAPEECIAAGIKDPRECGNYMFKTNAPRECLDAGITGEGRDDPRKCQQLMESKFGGREGPGGCAPGTICVPGSQWAPGTGPDRQMSGGNCAGISNSEERLKCYDGAGQFVKEYHEDFRKDFGEMQNKRRQCEENCRAQGEGGFLKENGNCVCEAPNYQEYGQQYPNQFRQDFNNQPKYNPYGDFKDGRYIAPPQSPRLPPYPPSGVDCARIMCQEGYNCEQGRGCVPSQGYFPPTDYLKPGYVDNTAKYDCSKLNCGPAPNYCDPWGGCQKGEGGFNPDGSSCDEGYEWSGSGCIPFGTGNYNFNQQPPTTSTEPTTSGTTTTEPASAPSTSTTSSEPAPTTSSEPAPSSGGDGGSVTGGVISNNKFLRFWFWK